MTSVQLASHRIGQSAPRLRQAIDLLRFYRVIQCDLLEQGDLVGHDLQIRNWPLPLPGHRAVSVQCLSAEDDALIGFGWGHAANSPRGLR